MDASLVRLLAATCITLAGCGGPAVLKEARPVESSRAPAEGKDERILVSVEAIVLRNGPGAWASDAEWDEYRFEVRALPGEPVEIRRIAIFDALDNRIEPRSDRGELVDGTREIEQRYEKSGRFARTGTGNDWVVTGTVVGGSAAAVVMAAPPLMAGGAAVLVVAAPVAVGVGFAFAGAGVVRLMNNAEVSGEIKRRATALPLSLPGGAKASLDLFFPATPLSGRAEIAYVDRHGEHRVEIDTRLAHLSLEPPPPTLVSRRDPPFPREARRAGVNEGYVVARLTLDRQGNVTNVELIQSVPWGVFDEEARKALRWWTYTEGRHDGRTVEARLEFKR